MLKFPSEEMTITNSLLDLEKSTSIVISPQLPLTTTVKGPIGTIILVTVEKGSTISSKEKLSIV